LITLRRLKFYVELLLVFALIAPQVHGVIAAPETYWLRPGTYATYAFEKACLLNGVWTDSGTYGWRCLAVDGTMATLNVSFHASGTLSEKVDSSLKQTPFVINNFTVILINTTTRTLFDAKGHELGYAQFWIDLARDVWSGEGEQPVRNMTLVSNYFGMTVDEVHIGAIGKESSMGLKPIETPFGKFDNIIAMWSLVSGPLVVPGSTRSNMILQFIYETRLGLLIGGTYMDDILAKVFHVAFLFQAIHESLTVPMELRLADTNLEIGVYKEEADLLATLVAYVQTYALAIIVIFFALPIAIVLLRGRVHASKGAN